MIDSHRHTRWEPEARLRRLGISTGQRVLDLGCGPGFWTLPLAEIVGSQGKVWALDISHEILDHLSERNPPTQVQLLCNELPTINLPDASVDWVWGAFVFHEVESLDMLIAEIRRVLVPRGKIAILDWRPDAGTEDGPPRHHRLASGKLIDLLRNAGFQAACLTWRNEDAYQVEAQIVGAS